MDTILPQNILFITLSISLIFITAGFTICVIYIILLLKSIYHLFNEIKKEGKKISDDIANIRAQAKSGGVKFASLILHAVSLFKKNKKSK